MGLFFLFKPTVRHSLRQPACEAARRRSTPAVGNSLRQKHDNAQISLEKFIYYAGKKEENNFYSAFLMKLPTILRLTYIAEEKCPHSAEEVSHKKG